MQNETMRDVSLWFRLGAVWLLAALSILCVKTAPLYWPLVTLGLAGFVLISLLRKKGLIVSCAAWLWVCCASFSFFPDVVWSSLFLAATALSWFLLYFQEKMIAEGLVGLDRERQRLKRELSESEEKARLLGKKEQELQQQLHLERVLAEQQRKQETEVSEEELQEQYRLLRLSFEEKSAALEAARQELYKIHGALHLLKEEQKEAKLHSPEEVALLIGELEQLEQECQALEQHIGSLYEFISLLVPSAKTKLASSSR